MVPTGRGPVTYAPAKPWVCDPGRPTAGWRQWPWTASSRHVGQRGRPRANLTGSAISDRDNSRNPAEGTQSRGAVSGQGLFTTTVTGYGTAALLSSGGPPIALGVSPQFPLVVDPDAFIASQGQLNQTFVTDVSWRNLIGESSCEAFSLRFDGHGVVYIQPEER